MMNMKTVAIVIPMYNCRDSITSVLDSIAKQSYVSHIARVILVNDGSKDDTLKICYEYKSTSTLPIAIIDKPNGGVASARNEGLRHIGNADLIAFCDSDDRWLPNKLKTQMDLMAKHPSIDILGSAFNDQPLRIGTHLIDSLHKGTVKEICIRNFPQPSTVIMKSSVYYKEGGFDEAQHYAEDGNYFLKLAAKYNLYYLPQRLIEYGFGKRGFGESGLSSNLKGMYDGNVKNLKEMKSMGYISKSFYVQMRLFHLAKYLRRILITKFS